MTRLRVHLGRPSARSRHRLLGFLALALFALAIVLLVTVGPFGSNLQRPGKPPLGYLRQAQGGRQYRVAAWTLGDASSLATATAAGAVDEVDFDWYHSQADGSVTATNENLKLVAAARDRGLNLFATVTNRPTDAGPFSRKVATSIMGSPETSRQHIAALAKMVLRKGYDGIDLDWEDLAAADRQRFSLFVEGLAQALHLEHRFLSVAVYAKTSEPGTWSHQKAMDYARLGAAADEVKIMTYAYSGAWSQPGPQTPTHWLDQVLTFAESRMPAAKIAVGLPFFGFDWHAGHAYAVTSRGAAAAARLHHARVRRDPASGEAVLHYYDAYGVQHIVYYQDARAVAAKLAFMRRHHPEVGGVALWVMGQETPPMWQTVRKGLRAILPQKLGN